MTGYSCAVQGHSIFCRYFWSTHIFWVFPSCSLSMFSSQGMLCLPDYINSLPATRSFSRSLSSSLLPCYPGLASCSWSSSCSRHFRHGHTDSLGKSAQHQCVTKYSTAPVRSQISTASVLGQIRTASVREQIPQRRQAWFGQVARKGS